jgi:hypothetical protein
LGVTVAGILGSSAEKSQRAATALGIPRAYRKLDELLADADVQVVHVTSPNRWHFAQASVRIGSAIRNYLTANAGWRAGSTRRPLRLRRLIPLAARRVH